MDLVFAPARSLSGTVRVPGDKSVTHRAYLLASIAHGVTRVSGANEGADCLATLGALTALGVRHHLEDEGVLALEGRPGGFVDPVHALDLGNSGTGMRLLLGLLAGQGTAATLVGDASLSQRPMARVVEPLRAMGASVTSTDGHAPLVLARGARLVGHVHELSVASAQVKSSILLAGLGARGRTVVTEPMASRDHTERMLGAFGVTVVREGNTVAVDGPARLVSPGALTVPGDFSAAFFWLVGGSIAGNGSVTIEGVGLNPTRTGALGVLRRMGADITIRNPRTLGGEPAGDLVVRPARLEAADVEAAEIPALVDELPALAIAQACAAGRSTVRGAGELRVKESDRIAMVVNGLQALGGKAHEREDGWMIDGGDLAGGQVTTRGDHRIAMAFGIASLRAGGAVTVTEGEMIDTSYPRFYIDLRDRVTSR